MNIRIMPMSFFFFYFIGKDLNYVQEHFFMKDLIEVNKGWYYYGKSGLDANEGDLLLFQMNNSIIASAFLDDIIQFSKPTIDGNNGAYIINRKSLKIFKPFDKTELRKLIPTFTEFGRTKQKFREEEVELKLLNERMNALE